MTCSEPECTRPARAGGLCSRDYQRQQRRQRGAPERSAPGEGARLSVRMPATVRAEVERRAEAGGVTLAEWVLGVVRAALKTTPDHSSSD